MALLKARPPRAPAFNARGSVTQGKLRSIKGALVLELPSEAAKYLGIDEAKDDQSLFILPLNGVIQVSAREPAVSIPALSMGKDEFVTQPS